MPDPTFTRLYPDIDPTIPLPPTVAERIAITVASAVLAFGASAGDLLIAGVGFVLLMFSLVTNSLKVHRKIRNEARSRFPREEWAEYRMARRLRLDIIVPALWLLIMAICALTFFLTPDRWYPWSPTVAAILTALIMWFMPGISPIWSEKDDHELELPTLPTSATAPYPDGTW